MRIISKIEALAKGALNKNEVALISLSEAEKYIYKELKTPTNEAKTYAYNVAFWGDESATEAATPEQKAPSFEVVSFVSNIEDVKTALIESEYEIQLSEKDDEETVFATLDKLDLAVIDELDNAKPKTKKG